MAETTLILRTDKSGAETIDRIVQESGGAPGLVTQPKHISGDVATWIVAITAFTQALPPLLLAIRDLIKSKRVSEVEIGGVRVVNPTAEMVERLLDEHLGAGE